MCSYEISTEQKQHKQRHLQVQQQQQHQQQRQLEQQQQRHLQPNFEKHNNKSNIARLSQPSTRQRQHHQRSHSQRCRRSRCCCCRRSWRPSLQPERQLSDGSGRCRFEFKVRGRVQIKRKEEKNNNKRRVFNAPSTGCDATRREVTVTEAAAAA